MFSSTFIMETANSKQTYPCEDINSYYESTSYLSGQQLKSELHKIISGHKVYSYAQVTRNCLFDNSMTMANWIILLSGLGCIEAFGFYRWCRNKSNSRCVWIHSHFKLKLQFLSFSPCRVEIYTRKKIPKESAAKPEGWNSYSPKKMQTWQTSSKAYLLYHSSSRGTSLAPLLWTHDGSTAIHRPPQPQTFRCQR